MAAWGHVLISKYCQVTSQNGVPAGFALAPRTSDVADAIKLIQASTDADPTNPLYLRSLGDLKCMLSTPDGVNRTRSDLPGALSAYRLSLKVDPVQSSLWYGLYVLETADASMRSSSNPLNAIKMAARHDRTNSFLSYLLAAEMARTTAFENNAQNRGLSSTPGDPATDVVNVNKRLFLGSSHEDRLTMQRVIETIKSGNASKGSLSPSYSVAVPPELSKAWGYSNRLGSSSA